MLPAAIHEDVPGAYLEAIPLWKRLHRAGHSWMGKFGGSLNYRRRLQLHSFAGHSARRQAGDVFDALRTRCLAWWRYHQARFKAAGVTMHHGRPEPHRSNALAVFPSGTIANQHSETDSKRVKENTSPPMVPLRVDPKELSRQV